MHRLLSVIERVGGRKIEARIAWSPFPMHGHVRRVSECGLRICVANKSPHRFVSDSVTSCRRSDEIRLRLRHLRAGDLIGGATLALAGLMIITPSPPWAPTKGSSPGVENIIITFPFAVWGPCQEESIVYRTDAKYRRTAVIRVLSEFHISVGDHWARARCDLSQSCEVDNLGECILDCDTR